MHLIPHDNPPMSQEIKATVIQADESSYLAVANEFPGLTGEGASKEACVADLTRKIEAYLSTQSQAVFDGSRA